VGANHQEVEMQYAVMIYNVDGFEEGLSEQELAVAQADYAAMVADPRRSTGIRLQPGDTATSVRVIGGKTLITDGPFADTKEVLGGIAVLEADNLDEALEFAARIPAARLGGVVEVRPVFQP
jgi:hypothetical protein